MKLKKKLMERTVRLLTTILVICCLFVTSNVTVNAQNIIFSKNEAKVQEEESTLKEDIANEEPKQNVRSASGGVATVLVESSKLNNALNTNQILQTELDKESGIFTATEITIDLNGNEVVVSKTEINIETHEVKIEKNSDVITENEVLEATKEAVPSENEMIATETSNSNEEAFIMHSNKAIEEEWPDEEVKTVATDIKTNEAMLNEIIQQIIEEQGQDYLIFYEEALEIIPEELRIASDGTFISAFGPSNIQVRAATSEEIMLIAKTIQVEAGDEPYIGKVVVGASVFNRVDAGRGTISEIITAKSQYASIEGIDTVDQDCMQAAIDAAYGHDPSRIVFPNGLLYFNVPGYADNRQNTVMKLRIGWHDCAREYGK